jgi:hypothetical protein
VLHQLLAIDPGYRAPLSWEFWMPWPSPDPNDDGDPRIRLADRDLRLSAALSADFDAIHEMSSTNTRECGAAMSFSFRSEDIDGTFPLPTYTEWLRSADWQPALDWHRRVLQVLAHRGPSRTWVLKNPAYLGCLDELVRTYPDACLVITHRDPTAMISSLVSLYATLLGAHGEVPDVGRLAGDLLERHGRLLDGLVDWVQANPAVPVRHVRYDEFLAAPLAVVSQIQASTGRTLSAETAAAVTAYLAAHPQHRHGAHAHSLDAVGLDAAAVRERFARYQDYFDVASD